VNSIVFADKRVSDIRWFAVGPSSADFLIAKAVTTASSAGVRRPVIFTIQLLSLLSFFRRSASFAGQLRSRLGIVPAAGRG